MRSRQLTGKRILIAEDELVIAMEMEYALRAEGAEIVALVPSVPSALREVAAANGGLDAVVLDLGLGHESAYPVADALRQQRIPFVFATAYSRHDIAPAYKDVTYLGKPVDMARVAAALARLIARAPRPGPS